MKRQYNPLKEERFAINEFLDFAETRGWDREDMARSLYAMLTSGNVSGTYYATVRRAMVEFAETRYA